MIKEKISGFTFKLGESEINIDVNKFYVGFFNDSESLVFYTNTDDVIGVFKPIDPSYWEIVKSLDERGISDDK